MLNCLYLILSEAFIFHFCNPFTRLLQKDICAYKGGIIMISRQVDTCRRYRPVPLSFLIDTANAFLCDIFVECDQVNVKSYDEMIRNLKFHGRTLRFFFNGQDELDAEKTIERIFQA